MTRMILVHVGTSLLDCDAFRHTPLSDEEIQNLKSGQAEQNYNLEDNFDALAEGLKEKWQKNNSAWGRAVSPAEIASLSLLERQPEDKIVLLTSDTPAGKFCGALLEKALQDDLQLPSDSGYPSFSDITVAHIEGVQINESQASGSDTNSQMHFVQDGLVNYVKSAMRYYRTLQPGDTLLFNITAGYKGLLPIARDLALLLAAHSREAHTRNPIQTTMCYLHDTSDSLIFYGALPVTFDHELLHESILDDARTESGSSISPHQALSPLFQKTPDKKWVLSPLGYVVATVYDELYREGRGDEGTTLPPPTY